MDAEPPQRPVDGRWRRPRTRRALWFAAAGVVLGLAATMCSTFCALSFQQTLALALPAAVLVIGGLAAAATEAGEGHLFRAGFKVGWLVAWWRSVGRRHGGNRP